MENRDFSGFVGKAVIFLLLLSLLVLFLYILGNYQFFLDGTQSLLLTVEKTATLFLAVCLLFMGILHITRKDISAVKRTVLFLVSLICAALSAGFSVFLSFILLWVGTAAR